jgi:hypothetical protein
MEMGRIAGQDEHASWRVRLQLIGVELIAQAYVENAGYNCVNSILRVTVWHQFRAVGRSNPNRVGPGLRGMTDNGGQEDRRWKRCEGFPVDIFGEDGCKDIFARLVGSNVALPCFHHGCSFLI